MLIWLKRITLMEIITRCFQIKFQVSKENLISWKMGLPIIFPKLQYFFASFFNSNFVIIFGFWSNIIIECAVFSKYKFEFCVFYLFHIGSVGIDKLNEIIHSDFDSIIFSCTYLEEICLKIALFSCNHHNSKFDPSIFHCG